MIKTLTALKEMTTEIECVLDKYENMHMPNFENYDAETPSQWDNWNNYEDCRKFEEVEKLIYGNCDRIYNKYNSVLKGLKIDADVKIEDASYRIVIKCDIGTENIDSDDGFVKYYNVYEN